MDLREVFEEWKPNINCVLGGGPYQNGLADDDHKRMSKWLKRKALTLHMGDW